MFKFRRVSDNFFYANHNSVHCSLCGTDTWSDFLTNSCPPCLQSLLKSTEVCMVCLLTTVSCGDCLCYLMSWCLMLTCLALEWRLFDNFTATKFQSLLDKCLPYALSNLCCGEMEKTENCIRLMFAPHAVKFCISSFGLWYWLHLWCGICDANLMWRHIHFKSVVLQTLNNAYFDEQNCELVHLVLFNNVCCG